MGVDTHQVFLVPGQLAIIEDGGAERLAPEVVHRVVVARNGQSALVVLENTDPSFRPLGATSLKEFEDAVLQVRATLNGDTRWPLVIEPGMA